MRIGLIGAPGSGKTALAHLLAETLGHEETLVLDGYVEDVEVDFDYKMGRFATYIGNIAIALRRHQMERAYQDRFKTLISCGTVVDTAVYMAAEATLVADPGEDHFARRHISSLAVLSCMVDDLFTYDFVFYLPNLTEPEDPFERTVATELRTGLEVFEVPYITLAYDDDGERLHHVVTALNV
jgi:energy-coupling factor transporter ATP-binding protein EcfA2